MGVTPSISEAQAARVTQSNRNDEPAPKPEARSKFEEAMRRVRDGGVQDDNLAGREGGGPFEPPVVRRFLQDGDDGQGSGDQAHGAITPGAAQPAAPADGAVVAGSPAEIASSHHEFANRIGLPAQTAGSETQLTMTDQRWIATYATVRCDDAGGLSVEIQTRSDANAEQQQQREALRSRLQARGHRVTSIQISGS